MKEATLYVDGMSCSSCAKTITIVLSSKEGITKVNVDSDTKKVVVQYDETKASEEQILDALKGMGYGFRRHPAVRKAPK